MKFIRPTTITDAVMASSSIAEPAAGEPAAWASGTTYAAGARVHRATTHRIYESLAGSNTGKTPETEPTWWVEVSPTNRWAAFDSRIGTASTGPSGTTFTLAPGIVDSIALLDVSAQTVQVEMTDSPGGSVVYSRSVSMDAANQVTTWYGYFFEEIVRRTSVVLTDLPPFSTGRITVTLTDGTNVSLGTCVVGRAFTVGESQKPAKVGIIDYSIKTTDAFGVTRVTPRAFARRMEVPVIVNTAAVDEVVRQLAIYRAAALVWSASDDFDALAVYGFYKDFTMDLTYLAPSISYCTLTIEGLT